MFLNKKAKQVFKPQPSQTFKVVETVDVEKKEKDKKKEKKTVKLVEEKPQSENNDFEKKE
jgi:hypothetical protein